MTTSSTSSAGRTTTGRTNATGRAAGTTPAGPGADLGDDPLARVRETALDIVTTMQELLGSEVVLGEADPAELSLAVGRLGASLALHPLTSARAGARFAGGSVQAGAAAVLRAVGVEVEGPAEPPKGDRRFADPAWRTNAAFYLLAQQHLLLERLTRDLVKEARVDELTRRKAEFALQQLVDAVAPSNQPWANPAVLKKAFDTGGLSLARGVRNLLRDVATNRGQPRQVVEGQFEVGKDLARTPGKVVFRNRLMELIQYEPQTEEVYAVPLLFSPPWINKYFVMDLAPKRSLVEWAVQHGHTAFMISYRNPDASMADVSMSDYLLDGPLAAMEVVQEITGAEQVNLVALCLGGTLAACLLAWLAAKGEAHRVRSATFLNTLLDFSVPGQLGIFTDEKSIQRMERRMAREGYLPGESMRTTFDLLRANDLVWNYVVNDWMLGEDPPAFDLLTWNSQATRMPARMQSEYLRSLYLENRLVRGELELAGERLDLGAIEQDSYFVSAEQDHIAPWRSAYLSAAAMGGKVRFVLSNSGHIAGVVNPPNPKSRLWRSESAHLPEDPDAWREQATGEEKSWWEDWTPWIARRGGEKREPPPMGSRRHAPLEDAPGSYVRQT